MIALHELGLLVPETNAEEVRKPPTPYLNCKSGSDVFERMRLILMG